MTLEPDGTAAARKDWETPAVEAQPVGDRLRTDRASAGGSRVRPLFSSHATAPCQISICRKAWKLQESLPEDGGLRGLSCGVRYRMTSYRGGTRQTWTFEFPLMVMTEFPSADHSTWRFPNVCAIFIDRISL